MLLNKKFYSFALVLAALSPFVVTTLESRADDTVPLTPSPTVVAPAAPVVEAPKLGASKQIMDTDISRFVQGFKVKKITDSSGTTHLTVYGVGLASCLRHVHIDLDAPKDNDTGVYAFRLTKRDVWAGAGTVAKADDDCDANKTKNCSRDPDSGCVPINQGQLAGDLGLNAVEATPLDQDGKITIRVDNEKDTDLSTAIQFRDISKAMGGPLDYKTPETISAEMDKKRAQERNELLVATCRGAEKGSRDDLENLKEMLGSEGLADKAKLITKLEKKVNDKELADFEAKLDSAETIEALNRLIDEANDFAKDHPDMKGEIVKFLVDGIAKKAIELDADGKDLKSLNIAKMKLAERALKIAHNLDRKNASLRAAYEKTRHLRTKETSSDSSYNETSRAEAINGFGSVLDWAASSKSTEARGALTDYINDMPANVKPYAAQVAKGGLASQDRDWLKAVYGQTLDQNAATHSMQEEFNAYRANSVGNPMYGGQSPYYGSQGGSSYGGQNGRF